MALLTVRMDKEQHDRLKTHCKSRGITISNYVRLVLYKDTLVNEDVLPAEENYESTRMIISDLFIKRKAAH